MHQPVAYDRFLKEYLEPYSWVNHLYDEITYDD
jgi:hypothetical protein